MIKYFFPLFTTVFILGCQSNTPPSSVVTKEPIIAPIVIDSTLPFQTAAKVEVLAYDDRMQWDRKHQYDTLVKDGKLNFNTTKIKQRILLTAAQQQEAYNILYNQEHCQSDAISMCYAPRHAFIFYDAKGASTTYMEVCFQCSNARMNDNYKLDGNCREKYEALAQLVKRTGITYGF